MAKLPQALRLGNPEHFPALLAALRGTFIICCPLCAAGIFASLSRGKLEREGGGGGE